MTDRLPSGLLAAPAGAVETRGITVYLSPTTSREEIVERVERYIATGFNFLVVKVFASGRVLYPSEATADLLGLSARQRRHRPDPVGMVLEAARQHGLPAYAGFELLEHGRPRDGEDTLYDAMPEWFIPEAWPPSVALREVRRAEAIVGSPDELRTEARWVSPIHPDARRYLGSLIVEALASYPFDGIYFDRLALPAAHDAAFLTDRTTSALLKRGGSHGDFFGERGAGADLDHTDWNDWLARQMRDLITYLRQRLYKVRPHLVMMLESLQADGRPDERAGALQVPWREALDLIAELVAPRFLLDGPAAHDDLTVGLANYGAGSPVLPVLEFRGADLEVRPFEQIRHSSALGFLVDAGRPLLERHWRFFEKLFEGRAMPSHTDPALAFRAVIGQAVAMLGEKTDLAALLRDMERVLQRADDAAHSDRMRQSVINNLLGLLERADRGELELPPDCVRWQVLRALGLLVRLQEIVHSRGQFNRATPYYT